MESSPYIKHTLLLRTSGPVEDESLAAARHDAALLLLSNGACQKLNGSAPVDWTNFEHMDTTVLLFKEVLRYSRKSNAYLVRDDYLTRFRRKPTVYETDGFFKYDVAVPDTQPKVYAGRGSHKRRKAGPAAAAMAAALAQRQPSYQQAQQSIGRQAQPACDRPAMSTAATRELANATTPATYVPDSQEEEYINNQINIYIQ